MVGGSYETQETVTAVCVVCPTIHLSPSAEVALFYFQSRLYLLPKDGPLCMSHIKKLKCYLIYALIYLGGGVWFRVSRQSC